MVLKRFYDEGLAQASYMVGCPNAGACAIIDPNRDFSLCRQAAENEGMRITSVTETHIHADYLSGARELAMLAGAELLLSAEGGPDWQYGFAHSDGATLLRHGDGFCVGQIKFRVVHTPGHTPEHISFIVTDESAAPIPIGAFTGDFVFVGDVGRPDLLEKAAQQKGTMAQSAEALYGSLRKFLDLLPDFAMLFPGHGAGSACGRALGGVPVTTLGYEKASNWAFRCPSITDFVDEVLAGQPDPPAYFAVMKRLNKAGPAILGEVKQLSEFDPEVLPQVQAETLIVDVRSGDDFRTGHIPGSLNLPATKQTFVTHAGSILPYDRPLTLIAANRTQAEHARKRLRLIGIDDVRGWLTLDDATPTATINEVEPEEAWEAANSGQATLLDVRNPDEWREGHAPPAQNIPLGRLAERAGEIDRTKPVAIYCQSGSRAMVACSVLARLGFSVANVQGGFIEYANRDLPVAVEGEA
jgi:hydroxyacylglutathione hydrolase